MTITRHFFKSHNFAYTQCVGNIDDHLLRIHVLSFQVESKDLSYVREVLDFRHLLKANRLTIQGMIEISELERRQSEDRDFRLAIIAANPLFEQIARIYGQVVSTPNLQVEVFQDEIDAALGWLGYRNPWSKQIVKFMRKHRSMNQWHRSDKTESN